MTNAGATWMIIEEVLGSSRPTCRTCGGTPHVLARQAGERAGIKMYATCHGASDTREIAIPDSLYEDGDCEHVLDAIQAPWFLKNWSEYRRPGPYAPRYPAHPRSRRRVAQ